MKIIDMRKSAKKTAEPDEFGQNAGQNSYTGAEQGSSLRMEQSAGQDSAPRSFSGEGKGQMARAQKPKNAGAGNQGGRQQAGGKAKGQRPAGGQNNQGKAQGQGGQKERQSQLSKQDQANKGRQARGRAQGKAGSDNRGSIAGDKLQIIPLGGLNEIGKNITALRCGDEIMIIDCGMSFPEDGMFGIDIVIPEFDYLVQNAKMVKGMILTHGHEDHIGAVPYLLKKIKLPIYGTRLTLGLVEGKLQEHGIKGDLRRIEVGDKVRIGKFKIDPIRATHSIADSLCLAIETPVGNLFHTGDFKIDYTPIDGDPMDFGKLAEVGRRGVDLMMCESTNAVKQGFSESEKKLGPILEGIFEDSTSRIIIATFASNVHRVQTIIDTAAKCKRKIALSGRSMLRVMDLAIELGYLKMPPNTLVDLNDINKFPDKKLVIITTGSQGEPMSALTRMANQEHRSVRIKKGDTVILSSSPIPGNEKTVSGVVNNLLELGAEVIYSDVADIHVSGHACAEEIKLMISLIKPKNFMPVHGEYRHLHQNALIGESLGINRKNIFILKNGNILEMGRKGLKISDKTISAEPVFVDGLGVGDIGTIVLKDRKLLSESGLILVVATIDAASGIVSSGPEIISRGFVHEKENEDVIEELKVVAADKLSRYELRDQIDWNAIRTGVKDDLRKFIYRKTKRSPVILTIIMEA